MRRHIVLNGICWTLALLLSLVIVRSAFVCDALHSGMWSFATAASAGRVGQDNFYLCNGRIGYQGYRETLVYPPRTSRWVYATSASDRASLASWFGGELYRKGTATMIEFPIVYLVGICVAFPFVWARMKARREGSRSGFAVSGTAPAGPVNKTLQWIHTAWAEKKTPKARKRTPFSGPTLFSAAIVETTRLSGNGSAS